MKSMGQDASEKELKKLIEIADTDGSGDIDFLEFMVLVAHKMKQDNSLSSQTDTIKAAFAIFDTDNSGTIDSKEMLRMMVNLGEPVKVCARVLALMRCGRVMDVWTHAAIGTRHSCHALYFS